MGLLLSVLVACVGVVELLAFYTNVTRSFVTASTQTNLTDLNRRYLEDFEKLKTQPVQCSSEEKVASSEDIELEFVYDRLKQRSPSPRSFLLTEKENKDRSRSPTPRRFLVAEQNGAAGKDLRKFVVEQKSSENARFVIKDGETGKSAFPLPKQFLVTESDTKSSEAFKEIAKESNSTPKQLLVQQLDTNSSEAIGEVTKESNSFTPKEFLAQQSDTNSSEAIKEVVKESNSSIPKKILVLESDTSSSEAIKEVAKKPTLCSSKQFLATESTSKSSEASFSSPKSFLLPDSDSKKESSEAVKRSPSPYPSLVLSAPRKSIELLENPIISVLEVDEDSSNAENNPVFPKSSLEVPLRKSFSHNSFETEPNQSNEIDDRREEYDEQFLDSLDGVKNKKMCRNSASRKSRKRRDREDCLSSSSVQNAHIAKTLTEAANVNRDGGEGASGDSNKIAAEPFWVKRY